MPIDFFSSPLGIALITVISSIIGALIALLGNFCIENHKDKISIKNESRIKKIDAYTQMLASINSLFFYKFEIATLCSNTSKDNDGNYIFNANGIQYFLTLAENHANIIQNSIPSISIYSDEETLTYFKTLMEDIQYTYLDVSILQKENLQKLLNDFGVPQFESYVRAKIKEL